MTVQDATDTLFKRYNQKIQKNGSMLHPDVKQRLMLMGIHALSHPELPIDKRSRWLGFIQGCLWMEGIIDLEEEREFSRELFQQAYKDEGIPVPESIDVVQANYDSMLEEL